MFLHIIKQSEYLHDAHNRPYMVYTNDGVTDSLIDYSQFDWGSITSKVYTTDLMYLEYLGIDLLDVEDLSFAYYNRTNKSTVTSPIQVETFYRQLYPDLKKTNILIPHSFILDQCRSLYDHYKPYLTDDINQFYKKQLDVFSKIESKGIMYKGVLHHSEYNFFTTTGRPSNKFGGVNFAALNKKDGTRSNLKSRYPDGVLIEVDFQSYHPRIIAELIGYEFPTDVGVYEYLARFYNKTQKPTADQIKKAKVETFKRIYGSLTHHDNIPYYKQACDYAHSVWDCFIKTGQISAPISKRCLYYENYKSMNTLTLFNYLIQLTETERNIELLHNNPILDKVILYIYDAILLDVREDEVIDTIETVNKTIATEKYPVKIKTGTTYGEMSVWDNKLILI